MPVRVLVDGKGLRGSTLITGFHRVGQTGYLATSYLIHALKAVRIGFIEVAFDELSTLHQLVYLNSPSSAVPTQGGGFSTSMKEAD